MNIKDKKESKTSGWMPSTSFVRSRLPRVLTNEVSYDQTVVLFVKVVRW